MKTFTFFALGLIATPLVAAIPTAHDDGMVSNDNTPFSFERWANAIATGEDHLSVDEVLAQMETQSLNVAESPSLQKRLRCNHLDAPPAAVPGAVQCIDELARAGGRLYRLNQDNPLRTFCTRRRAMVVGLKGGNVRQTASSGQDIARSLGLIMDNCWRADNTVQGDHFAWGNGDMNIHLNGRV